MSAVTLDRLLALLVVALASTGLLSLWVGAPSGAWLFVVHGVLAGCLAAAVVLKVRRSVPRAVGGRRWGRLGLGLLVTFAAAAALTGGYLWVASGEIVWVDVAGLIRWTVLTLHAWIGLALVPLVLVHLLPKRWRLLRPRVSSGSSMSAVSAVGRRLVARRSLIAGAAFGAVGVGLFGAAAVTERLRGGERRFTGSRWLPAGGIPPSTTFLGEGTPAIDLATWRLSVANAAGTVAEFTLDELRALGEESMSAVLDCTSGWAMETDWQGVRLGRVLDAAGLAPTGGQLEVRSVTGWSTSLPTAEARGFLLAWSVAGQPLPAANGAPLRLVAPDHRGLEWVKWLSEIRSG
jgi:DMSO/TMAO reductase YedYZ molybdopterin-dependent catalytic subunit